MSILKEFKEFAVKGNVVDMAVGVIIGGAFGKVVTSFLNDLVMPPLGFLTGGMDFNHLAVTLAVGPEPVRLRYGAFIGVVADFLIMAFSVFMLVKLMNSLKKREAFAPTLPPTPSAEEKLLAEIRDLLKEKK